MSSHEDDRQATPSDLAEETRRMDKALYKWLQAEKRYRREADEQERRAQLPTFAVHGDAALTTLIDDPCWLLVQRHTDLTTGQSWLSMYKSPLVSDDYSYYQEAMMIIWDREVVSSETVVDPNMMFGRAELIMYEPEELDEYTV